LPQFSDAIAEGGFASPATGQRLPRYSSGFEGSISIEPAEPDWRVVAAVKYGRSNGVRHNHQDATAPSADSLVRYTAQGVTNTHVYSPSLNLFADTTMKSSSTNLLLDFKVGKEVGLGGLGRGTDGFLSLGIRYAQFTSRADTAVNANPEFHWEYQIFAFPPFVYIRHPLRYWHTYNSSEREARSFHAVGPSISWDAERRLAGNAESSELDFDWGINASALFGRQRASVHHQSAGRAVNGRNEAVPISFPPFTQTKARSVVVPNVGGFAGLSLKFPNAKLNLGYRADFFFGAMDGGIDARKTYDRNFYGPFATISIGLGGSSE
jgi:hypothetical protein